MTAENPVFQIALSIVPGIGAVTARHLVRHCGSATAVFQTTKKALCAIPGIGTQLADNIRNSNALAEAEAELERIARFGLGHLYFLNPDFPAELRQTYDCPVNLFFRLSDTRVLSAPRKVAIVGTRQPSDYGRAMVHDFVAQLERYQVMVISGLAYGIDILAHRKAIDCRIANVGVLGHGLGRIYPEQHRTTALKMMEHGGLLTEYHFNKGPDREHFPMRNRIIAGLCDALVVVESGAQGGSMISAELAFQYERPVFALPGRVGDPKSAGCNELIRSNRAQLIESAADLADALGWSQQEHGVQRRLFDDLTPDQERVVAAVRGQPNIAIDALSLATGLGPGQLAALILELEFKGVLRTLPGKKYLVL